MRITVYPECDEYVKVTFYHDNTTVTTGLLGKDECVVLAERLRQAADSIEHYARVIASKDEVLTSIG
jgi:hypothetical protein